MRIQRSIALLILAAAAAPAFGQHDAKAFKPVDGGRRLDAFDDRMDRCVLVCLVGFRKGKAEAGSVDDGGTGRRVALSARAHPQNFP